MFLQAFRWNRSPDGFKTGNFFIKPQYVSVYCGFVLMDGK